MGRKKGTREASRPQEEEEEEEEDGVGGEQGALP